MKIGILHWEKSEWEESESIYIKDLNKVLAYVFDGKSVPVVMHFNNIGPDARMTTIFVAPKVLSWKEANVIWKAQRSFKQNAIGLERIGDAYDVPDNLAEL